MKKVSLLVPFISLFLAVCPAHAQWQRGAFRGLKKVPTKTLTTRTLATQRAVNQALKNSLSNANQLLKSTLTLKLSKEKSLIYFPDYTSDASSFVFVEEYNGKTYLWGATATHYFLNEPFLEHPQTKKELPIQIVAQGHHGHNDVSLFPIPTELEGQITPLRLAQHSPQIGEKLHSSGYFDDGFHVERNRVVKTILPTRFLTSLEVEDKLSREGACGGPVLNEKNEIVGMHVGSSETKQVGFVVPVEYIHELLYAYRHNGQALHPLYFNGRQLGDININEFIYSIEVWQNGKQLQEVLTYPRRAYINYNHLEELVDASQADKIVITIERSPFSVLEKDQRSRRFQITYYLHTFHVSERKRI